MKGLLMKKFTLTFNKSLGLLAILSLICVLTQSIIQIGTDFAAYGFQLSHPLIILLNFLPIFLLMSLIFFLTNSIWKSFFITSLPLTILLIINYYKTYFLDAPLVLTDISQAFEAVSIAQNYTLTFSLRIFLTCLSLFFIVVFLLRYVQSEQKTKKQTLVGISCILIFSVLSYLFIYYVQHQCSGELNNLRSQNEQEWSCEQTQACNSL